MKTSSYILLNSRTLQDLFGFEDENDTRAVPTYQLTQETLHDDAERGESGDMLEEYPTILNRKAKLTLSFGLIPVENMERFFYELKLVYAEDLNMNPVQIIDVRYRDFVGMRQMQCYASPNLTGTLETQVDGTQVWRNVKISFIEK